VEVEEKEDAQKKAQKALPEEENEVLGWLILEAI